MTGPPPAAVDPQTVPVFDPLTYGVPAPDPTTGRVDVTAPVVLEEGPGFRDGSVQLVHTINGAASPAVPPIVVQPGSWSDCTWSTTPASSTRCTCTATS